jgi:transketolase|tara:strand:+ start:19356 stop:20132 length:777 start_codon:yes stop_codon:yes gene_type:complete
MKLSANKLRQHVLKMVYEKQSGHIGGSFSLAELIAYLYSEYDIASDSVGTSKLILSKGHAVPILYAALYELGILTDADMAKFREIDSPLQGHPDKLRLPYMHATTGSLGQGLSIALGHALAMKLKALNKLCFCIIGDGEIQEGQIWEAFMLAPKFKLDNLVCFIDSNKSQNDGLVENILPLDPLKDKMESFNWDCLEIDGNSINEISTAMKSLKENGKPKCIILNTQKGAGVSFMNDPAWHAKAPNKDEYEAAMKELK